MIFKACTFCLGLLFISGFSAAENENFGPFHLKLLKWTDCSNSDPNQIHMNITVQDANKTVDLLNGVIVFPEGFSDEMMMTLEVAVWRNESWVEKIYSFKFKKACKGLQELVPSSFSDAAHHWNVADSCPISKGAYLFKDFRLLIDVNIKAAQWGIYKGKYVIQKDGVPKGCFEIFFEVIKIPQ